MTSIVDQPHGYKVCQIVSQTDEIYRIDSGHHDRCGNGEDGCAQGEQRKWVIPTEKKENTYRGSDKDKNRAIGGHGVELEPLRVPWTEPPR